MRVSPSVAAIASLAIFAACNGASTGSTIPPASAVELVRAVSPYPTALPKLYVDHNGVLGVYRLPLKTGAKPISVLSEDPGAALPPQIAVNNFGAIAIATTAEMRLFEPPIASFDPKHAKLRLPFNGSITAVGESGAELNDMRFDNVGNLWLDSNLAGEITELRKPLRKTSVAQLFVLFGVRGTKTSGFGTVGQIRFDVNNALYAYAASSATQQLFKLSFPYAAQPSSTGLNLSQVDIVDPSQYLPSNPDPAPMMLGQYVGALHSPPPQQPPPPPVDELAQFNVPIDPHVGPYPAYVTDQRVGALIADPPRVLFYTLDVATGRLDVWKMPLTGNAKPVTSFGCFAGRLNCQGKGEHLFLGP